MTVIRNSHDRLTSAGAYVLCLALFLPAGGLVAADPPPAQDSVRDESEVKPLRAEKPETATLVPKPRQETRAERRERLQYQARNGLGSMPNLIGIPQIQRELNLSEAQLKEIADQTRRLHIYVRSRSLDVIRMPRERQVAEMRKIQLETRPGVEQRQTEMLKVLTDEQRLRLLGISLQMRGPKSLIDEELIELLELSDEQVESILVILEEHEAKLQKLASKPPSVPKVPLVAIQSVNPRKSLNDEVEKQILEVLTESQRAKLKELQGEPYEVQTIGPLPTLIEPSETNEKKTLKELERDN